MIPIFTSEKYFNITIDSFSYCRKEKGLKVYAYVIMDVLAVFETEFLIYLPCHGRQAFPNTVWERGGW